MVCVRGAQVPPRHVYMTCDSYAQGRTRKKGKTSKIVGYCKSGQKGKRGKTGQKEGKKRGKKEKELTTRSTTPGHHVLKPKAKENARGKNKTLR